MRGYAVHHLVVSLLLAAAPFSQNQQSSTPAAHQTTITVTVTEHDHHPVPALLPENFTLYEDGRQQPIDAVVSGDVPACVGILVDESGSMRGRHNAIAAAMGEFVRAGNPGNQYFAVLFNDDPLLQEDFTHDAAAIEHAIARADPRGGTAFYDSLIASADHLAEGKDCHKRVLLLVTDGVDNESRKTLENTLRELKDDGNPLIYAIGLQERMTNSSRGKRVLEVLTAPSGGAAVMLGDFGDIRKATRRIAEELRSQYTLTYVPADAGTPQPRVIAHAQGGKSLDARINIAQEPVVRAKTISPSSSASAQAAIPSSAAEAPRGPDCISGTVVDEDQYPVARIRVQAMPAFGPSPYAGKPSPYSVTDAQGHFRLAELVKGNYRLYARPETYSREEGLIYRNEDRTPIASSESCANVTVKFLTRFATLKIHLIDAVTREPIPDYGILLRNASGEAFSTSRFDQETGIRVPPGIELTVQAWVRRERLNSGPIRTPSLRSAPLKLTTPAAEKSQEITLELDQRSFAPENNP